MLPQKRKFLAIASKIKSFLHISISFSSIWWEDGTSHGLCSGGFLMHHRWGEIPSDYNTLLYVHKSHLSQHLRAMWLLPWSSSMDIWVSERCRPQSYVRHQAFSVWILHILIKRLRKAKAELGKLSTPRNCSAFFSPLSLWNWSFSFKIKKRNIIIWKFVR